MSAGITFDLDRHVPAPAGAVRAEVGRTLTRLGFRMEAEGVTLLEATRGSQIAAASMRSKALPVVVRVRVEGADGAGTRIAVALADRWRTPLGRTWGINSRYRQVFTEVTDALDAALERLGGDRAAFTPGRFASRTGDVAPLENANAAGGRAGEAIAGAADRALAGPRKNVPKALRGLDLLELRAPAGRAGIDASLTHGMLTAGAMVAAQPGGMPPNLAADVERLTARLEDAVNQRGDRVVRVDLAQAEVPVAEFLHQQARIRASLPLRVRQVCGDCRFERVVNPDFQRLAERNRKLRAVMGGVGIMVTPSGASPFALAGSLFRAKKLDPDFVCPRCQGMHHTTGLVTFCPGCGERRDESVLRSCGKCGHDFRRALEPGPIWSAEPEPVAEAEIPPPPPALAGPPPGWHRDPYGRHELRWWDGSAWTADVADGGVAARDPVPIP
ncbi:MAG: DUF2510 domain-containing protein [Thermoleophilia bacterium]|jgi:hypothetical protein|nr:DUF2510 domain-containing protein [Thermoleophilia bacterium]